MYTKKNLDSYFYTTNGFYILFIPVKVPYKKLYELANQAGVKKKEKHGPILESGKLFGYGWIGAEIEKPSSQRSDVVHLAGEFSVYEHKGPYKSLGAAHKKIRKENPRASEYYNLYLDDPEKVNPQECRTHIYFR